MSSSRFLEPPPRPPAAPDDEFARFALVLGHHVDLDLTHARPDSSLRDELGFDSLAMAEVLVLLAEHGVDLPEELVPELRTLGDLHHCATVMATVPIVAGHDSRAARAEASAVLPAGSRP